MMLILICLLAPDRIPTGEPALGEVGFQWQCYNYHLEIYKVDGEKCYFRQPGTGNHLEYLGNPATREQIQQDIEGTTKWQRKIEESNLIRSRK